MEAMTTATPTSTQDQQAQAEISNPLYWDFKALFGIGLTQKTVADELKVSQSHVSSMSQPDTKNSRPSASVISGLAALKKKHRRMLDAWRENNQAAA